MDRFDRLAVVLRQQPFDDETEECFRAKWLELIGLYETEHPGAVPPLLELDAALNLRPVWPKR